MIEKAINVLSLFDGMSCGQLALKRSGISVNNYYASEIDKWGIKTTKHNFPNTIHIGDCRNVNTDDYEDIDILIGGSPCQSFSFSGKQEGMSTTTNEEIVTLERYLELKKDNFEFKGQSYLFWEYVRILREIKPKYFLLENVVMSKKWESVITETLGAEPILINSSLVSAQNRKRLYWTNIPGIEQPEDRGINLQDILDDNGDNGINPSAIRGRNINKATIIGRRINENGKREDYNKDIEIIQCLEVRKTNTNKSNCLTTVQKDNVLTTLPIGRHIDAYGKHSGDRLPFRHYSLTELCKLQTVPTDYFPLDLVSESQAKKMIGNGWTVDVISHIFNTLKK